jgi:uncharacterized membrane-anchored protein YjiN (DUF445 family)
MKYQFKISMGLAVTLGLAVVVVSGFWWAASSPQAWRHVFWAGAKAGLIGSLVDWMALVMVFQQKWWIPFSGVIPRHKDELMDQIAEAVEKEWLTPDALRKYLGEVSLCEPLVKALNGILNEPINRKALAQTVAQWADGRLSEDQTQLFLEQKIGGMLPRAADSLPLPLKFLGRGALKLGLADALDIPARLSQAVIQETREQLEAHRRDGTLENRLFSEIQRILPMIFTPKTEEALKEGFVRFFCDHVRPGQVVRQHLSTFTAEDIRHMVEGKARKHLEWIRVNGAVGGFLLGILFEVFTRMAAHLG